MKFSKQFDYQKIPEWYSDYFNYERFKAISKDFTTSVKCKLLKSFIIWIFRKWSLKISRTIHIFKITEKSTLSESSLTLKRSIILIKKGQWLVRSINSCGKGRHINEWSDLVNCQHLFQEKHFRKQLIADSSFSQIQQQKEYY